jgi:uncharacterized protein YegP (UPF0339 family)
MQHPKFVMKSRDGAYHFHLTASNGEIILVSQKYASLTGAENAIASVKANAPVDERYERRRSRKEEPYFVLKASNGEVIGTSEMYASSAAMENGMAAVQRAAPGAGVERWGEG